MRETDLAQINNVDTKKHKRPLPKKTLATSIEKNRPFAMRNGVLIIGLRGWHQRGAQSSSVGHLTKGYTRHPSHNFFGFMIIT
jgi:hypothetical protein